MSARPDLDVEPKPLGFLDFTPLEALGYALFAVGVAILPVLVDWVSP